MAKSKVEPLVTQSLLERLQNEHDPEWPTDRMKSIGRYRESVRRDVEDLLNTRQPVLRQLDAYTLASASVLNYGLPDVQNYGSGQGRDPQALTAAIRHTLKTFEPRILRPQVSLSRTDASSRALRFHIEGQLVFDTMKEEITFDTVLELVRGTFEVH